MFLKWFIKIVTEIKYLWNVSVLGGNLWPLEQNTVPQPLWPTYRGWESVQFSYLFETSIIYTFTFLKASWLSVAHRNHQTQRKRKDPFWGRKKTWKAQWSNFITRKVDRKRVILIFYGYYSLSCPLFMHYVIFTSEEHEILISKTTWIFGKTNSGITLFGTWKPHQKRCNI